MCVWQRGRGREAASASAYRSTSEAGHTQAWWKGRLHGGMGRDGMGVWDREMDALATTAFVGARVFLYF